MTEEEMDRAAHRILMQESVEGVRILSFADLQKALEEETAGLGSTERFEPIDIEKQELYDEETGRGLEEEEDEERVVTEPGEDVANIEEVDEEVEEVALEQVEVDMNVEEEAVEDEEEEIDEDDLEAAVP